MSLIEILEVFHVVELLSNPTLGATVSNLYVHIHDHVFHALSYAHRCRYHVHCVLRVSDAPFEYDVPFARHCANVVASLVVQYAFAPLNVDHHASLTYFVIEIFAFFHAVELFVPLNVGLVVSTKIALLHVVAAGFHAVSYTVFAGNVNVTFQFTLDLAVYVNVNVLFTADHATAALLNVT